MLRLLGSPEWRRADGCKPLPVTLPAGLLIYVTCMGGSVERERIETLIWPDDGKSASARRLRVNLHRLHQWLLEVGIEPGAFEADRTRVIIRVDSDIEALRRAASAHDVEAMASLRPHTWLASYPHPNGSESLARWRDEFGHSLREMWSRALQQASGAALRLGDLRQAEQALRVAESASILVDGDEEFRRWARLGDQAPEDSVRAAWLGLVRSAAQLPASESVAGLDAKSGLAHPVNMVRHRESAWLRSSRLPIAVITGEAGSGKTSLLTSCFPGAPTLHCREGLKNSPFKPVLDWLHPRIRSLQKKLVEPESPLRPYRLDLARLLPELAPHEPLPTLDMRTAKARLLEALLRSFEAYTKVLLVDDLQWCDSATLELLEHLALRGTTQLRAAARSHECPAHVSEVLDRLRGEGLAGVLTLPALDSRAMLALCRARWPKRAWTEAQSRWLARAAGGNAFAAVELVVSGSLPTQQQLDSCGNGGGTPNQLPPRVQALVHRRVQRESIQVRHLVQAAAVAGQSVTPSQLTVALGLDADSPEAEQALERTLAAGLLVRDEMGRLACAHDLLRTAVCQELDPTRKSWLHRRWAKALAAQQCGEGNELCIAEHWVEAGELQQAFEWQHRAAQAQLRHGAFADATRLWQVIARESATPVLTLKARLGLAQCDLLHDLEQGRRALLAVRDNWNAVPAGSERQSIEAQTLSGLVDNAVFSGDMDAAARWCADLQVLLPGLEGDQRMRALEVLIEFTMRQPDLPAARRFVEEIWELAPRHPTSRSLRAQVDWVCGDVRSARDGFERLLARHAEFCSGLTIENDLAVMRYTLGDLAGAEDMARRSLVSWRGVAHTETLSKLVLGSVLTSAGRLPEAEQNLTSALELARQQSSSLFECEALARLGRVKTYLGDLESALSDLSTAWRLCGGKGDPLRRSQILMNLALAQAAAGGHIAHEWIQALQDLAAQSEHPLVKVRAIRALAARAALSGDAASLRIAALHQARLARAAGLLEFAAEARLLLASAYALAGEAKAGKTALARSRAQESAQTGGYGLLQAALTVFGPGSLCQAELVDRQPPSQPSAPHSVLPDVLALQRLFPLASNSVPRAAKAPW